MLVQAHLQLSREGGPEAGPWAPGREGRAGGDWADGREEGGWGGYAGWVVTSGKWGTPEERREG